MFENQNYWLESSSIASMKEVISTHPGKIRTLVDRFFVVTKQWNRLGTIYTSGRRAYRDIWTLGATGVVSHIVYDSHNGWGVDVEYTGPIEDEFLEPDECYLVIPIQEFLINTRPLEPQAGSLTPSELQTAVNDAVY